MNFFFISFELNSSLFCYGKIIISFILLNNKFYESMQSISEKYECNYGKESIVCYKISIVENEIINQNLLEIVLLIMTLVSIYDTFNYFISIY